MGKDTLIQAMLMLTSPWMVIILILSLPILLTLYSAYGHERMSKACDEQSASDPLPAACTQH